MRRNRTVSGRTVIDIMFGIIIFVSVSFYFVWVRTEVLSLGYEISRAQERKRQALEENSRLNLEVASLKSPDRIEALAREIGLVIPSKDQVIEVYIDSTE